tara:strand:+ start:944 stop:2551 length:1608 start_codon:yes stop_codon:yes gene_type:complete
MAEPYETPPELKDVYAKDKERYKESDRLIEEGDLKGAAEVHPDREELKNNLIDQIDDSDSPNVTRQVLGYGYEVGAGVAFDAATSWLGWTGPLWIAANYAEGAISNAIGQAIRGDDFSLGEIHASGLLGTIPLSQLRLAKPLTRLFGETGSIQRGITSGAIMGGTDISVTKAIDEQRLPTTGELATGVLTGGVLGGSITGAIKAVPELGNKLLNQIESDPYSKWHPITGRLGLTQTGTVGAMRRTPAAYGRKERRLTEPVNIETVKELQSKYGGSDSQVEAFVQANKAAEKDVRNVIDLLNSLSLRDLGSGKVLRDHGIKLTRKQEQGIIKQITEQGDLYSLGHIRAVKNLWLAGDKGANRITNMEPEMWHNLEQIIYNELGDPVGTKIVQLGNAARKANYDKDDLINLVEGVSRTLDEEYLKFIDPEITDFFDFLPREFHDHFEESIEASMRMKRRFFGKQNVIPRQQRDLHQKWLREAIDDYLAGMDNQGLGTLMNAMFQEGNRIPPWMRKVNQKLNPPKSISKKKYRKKKPL